MRTLFHSGRQAPLTFFILLSLGLSLAAGCGYDFSPGVFVDAGQTPDEEEGGASDGGAAGADGGAPGSDGGSCACDDGNPCTTDSCTQTGCVYAPSGPISCTTPAGFIGCCLSMTCCVGPSCC